MHYTYCFKCKDHTDTKNPKLITKFNKKTNQDAKLIEATCTNCNSQKYRIVQADTPLDLSEDKILELLPIEKPAPKKGKALTEDTLVTTGSSIKAPVIPGLAPTEDEEKAAFVAAEEDIDPEGSGLFDGIASMFKGKQKTLGDAAADFVKKGIRQIPVVGDLLVDSGLADQGIDWFSSNVYQPVKKWLGFGYGANILDVVKDNDSLLRNLAEKMLEENIGKGNNKIATYIGDLRQGSEEEKALAHVLMKTVTKPRFNKFLKDNNIPSTMSILEAMMKYKSRDKPWRNDEEKSRSILTGKGYSFTLP